MNATRRFKPRLQRLKWLFTDHPLYYITLCTEPRRPILANSPLHQSFIRFANGAPPHGILPGYFMIMPDHIHLFAGFQPQALSLSKWIKSMKNSMSKTLRAGGICAPHWEKDFFDHVMRSEESYRQKVEYVRQNPVRAGLSSVQKIGHIRGRYSILNFAMVEHLYSGVL